MISTAEPQHLVARPVVDEAAVVVDRLARIAASRQVVTRVPAEIERGVGGERRKIGNGPTLDGDAVISEDHARRARARELEKHQATRRTAALWRVEHRSRHCRLIVRRRATRAHLGRERRARPLPQKRGRVSPRFGLPMKRAKRSNSRRSSFGTKLALWKLACVLREHRQCLLGLSVSQRALGSLQERNLLGKSRRTNRRRWSNRSERRQHGLRDRRRLRRHHGLGGGVTSTGPPDGFVTSSCAIALGATSRAEGVERAMIRGNAIAPTAPMRTSGAPTLSASAIAVGRPALAAIAAPCVAPATPEATSLVVMTAAPRSAAPPTRRASASRLRSRSCDVGSSPARAFCSSRSSSGSRRSMVPSAVTRRADERAPCPAPFARFVFSRRPC